MPSAKTLTHIKNHPLYHIKGGDLSILVDDTRFLVPSVFFTRESPDFKERYQARTSSESASKSSQPVQEIQEIMIHADENVTPDDFAQLCWIFLNEKLSVYETTLQNWQTILRLANQYKFAEVKDLAFREIDKPSAFDMTLIDRIVLYRKYNAERKYLEKYYVELFSRPEPLTIEEGDKLSLKLALLISGARERLRATSDKLALSDPLPASMHDTVKAMVTSIFWDGPTPDLSRITASTSSSSAAAHANGAGGPSSTSNATSSDFTATGASNGAGGVFSTFGMAGKKGRKKNGIVGDWDDL